MTSGVYILSGLGADERMFQRIDFTGYGTTFIRWIPPGKHETIVEYASRLLAQIPESNPTLIGLSFGGMIAVEIARQVETEKVILISSVKTKSEIAFYFRWLGAMGLHKLVPISLMKRPNIIANWFFGAASPADKQLLRATLADTDPKFMKWAIDAAIRWKNNAIPKNITHIHGTADRILPIRFVECDEKIDGGGHLMVLKRAEEVTGVIRTAIYDR